MTKAKLVAQLRYKTPITSDDERTLFPAIRAGDADALDKIVNNFLLLAYKEASAVRPHGMDELEANSCAHDALLRACKVYDETKGYAFSCFLRTCVRNEIRRVWKHDRRLTESSRLPTEDMTEKEEHHEVDMDSVHWSLASHRLGEEWSEEVLSILTPRERAIVEGVLFGGKKFSDLDIRQIAGKQRGKTFTRQAVRIIYQEALTKMKRFLERLGHENLGS